MSDTEFKVGDRIRVIDYRRMHKGLAGTVREYRGPEAIIVDFDGKGEGSGSFNSREIEAIKGPR